MWNPNATEYLGEMSAASGDPFVMAVVCATVAGARTILTRSRLEAVEKEINISDRADNDHLVLLAIAFTSVQNVHARSSQVSIAQHQVNRSDAKAGYRFRKSDSYIWAWLERENISWQRRV